MANKPNANCLNCKIDFYSKNTSNLKLLCRDCKVNLSKNNCANCGKETKNPKYCSKNCSAIQTGKLFPKRKTKKICTICQEKVLSYKHSRCQLHQKEYLETRFDFIKNLTLEYYWKKKSLSNLHSSSKNAHIRALGRSWFKELLKKSCFNCNYSKHVELCHIKPIKDFLPTDKLGEVNHPNNVIQLCRNCHWEFDKGLLKLIK